MGLRFLGASLNILLAILLTKPHLDVVPKLRKKSTMKKLITASYYLSKTQAHTHTHTRSTMYLYASARITRNTFNSSDSRESGCWSTERENNRRKRSGIRARRPARELHESYCIMCDL